MAAIVIADASPLIALARVNGLGWLQQLFTEVVVTDVVLSEVLTGRYPDTETPIQQALAAGWLQATVAGSSEPALLLIDGRAGRAVAQELGITVAGTAAVIGLARQRGLIASARDVFAALHASDFRIAPAVIQAVLVR